MGRRYNPHVFIPVEHSSKVRLLGTLGAIILAATCYLVYARSTRTNKTEKQTAPQCKHDEECPDRLLCDPRGICVSVDVVRPVRGETGGRGRAGEGDDQRVTFSKQTQR